MNIIILLIIYTILFFVCYHLLNNHGHKIKSEPLDKVIFVLFIGIFFLPLAIKIFFDLNWSITNEDVRNEFKNKK